jgi:RimK family alpha-L-glutamate ligase
MKIRLLVLATKKNGYVINKIGKEAGALGCEIKIAEYGDVDIKLGTENLFSVDGENIENFDGYIFRRALSDKEPDRDLSMLRWSLTRYLTLKGKYVLDSKLILGNTPNLDKLSQMIEFSRLGISIPETKYTGGDKALNVERIQTPIVVKDIVGSQGKGVKLVETSTDLEKILADKFVGKVIFQEPLTTRVDYRVMVLSGEILGVMERKPVGDAFVSNVSSGGIAKAVELTDKLRVFTMEVIRLLDLEFAGIDVMFSEDGKPCLLEVNGAAVFKGFEKVTGINVAKKLVEYMIEKVK